MADMMNRGMPPQRGMQPQDGMQSSVFNIKDQMMNQASGKISPNMTVGQYLETTMGIKWDDPLIKLAQVSQQQLKGKDTAGKLMNQPTGMPPQPMGQENNIDSLMNSIK